MPSVGHVAEIQSQRFEIIKIIKIIKIIRWAAGGGIFIAVDYVSTEVLLSLSPGGPRE